MTRPRRAALGICRSRMCWKAGRISARLDGTASIMQPLIRPLYDTRTAHELVAMLGGGLTPSSYDIVRDIGARPTERPAISTTGGGNRCRTA